MTSNLPIALAGATLQADPHGALLWPEEATLIVADLHLEKGSSYAGRSRPQFLPPYDTRATIERLEGLVARHDPRRVICLGDSVHDRGAAERMAPEDSRRISDLTAAREWIWIAGNHDPEPPSCWGGVVLREVAIGPVVFRHQATACRPEIGTAEISGHFHPTASVSTRSGRVTGRCFASDGHRMLLPAFGAYAGGLNVLDPAIAGLFEIAFRVWVLGRSRIFALSSAQLTN